MGKLTISLDFELGWRAVETGLWEKRETQGVYDNMRPAISRFTARQTGRHAARTFKKHP